MKRTLSVDNITENTPFKLIKLNTHTAPISYSHTSSTWKFNYNLSIIYDESYGKVYTILSLQFLILIAFFFTSIAISSRHLRYFEPKPFICKHQVLLYLTKSNLYGANVYLLSDFCVFHVCHDSNLIESSYSTICTITTLSDPCFSHCSPP